MIDRHRTWMLILLAIAARALAILVLQSHLVPNSTYEHGEIAANLLNGQGFSVTFLGAFGPTSQQAPLYPAFVAFAYLLGGIATPTSLLILQLAQAVLGGWMVAEVIQLTRTLAPENRHAPLLAGAVAALHPTLVYAATHVQVAPLASALLVATLARATSARSIRDTLIVGLLLGLLILTDPILGLVAIGAFGAIIHNWSGYKHAIQPLIALTLTSVCIIMPWIARNYAIHHEIVFIKSTFGYAFWQGNCDLSEGTDKVVRASVEAKLAQAGTGLRDLNATLWAARHEAGYLDDIALTPADYHILSRVSEPERSRILFRRALFELGKQPGRYARLCLRRLRYFFLFDETNPKTRNTLYRITHVALTISAILGFILARPDVRRKLGPIMITIGLIAAFHTMTIVSARFHIPIEPLFAVLGGLALTRFSPSVNPSREFERLIGGQRLGKRFELARTL